MIPVVLFSLNFESSLSRKVGNAISQTIRTSQRRGNSNTLCYVKHCEKFNTILMNRVCLDVLNIGK